MVINKDLLVLGEVEENRLEALIKGSRDVNAELVQYKMNHSGYLLAIIDNHLVGVLRFDHLLGDKEKSAIPESVLSLTKQVQAFSEEVGERPIASDSEASEIAQFLRTVIKSLSSIIDEAFNEPISVLSRAKRLLADALKHVQNQKLVWSGPIKTVERELRLKIEEYTARKREEGKQRLLVASTVELDEDLVCQRILDALEAGMPEEGVRELLSLLDGEPERIPQGSEQKLDLGPGVHVRTYTKFEVVDLTRVKREYLKADEKKIGAVVKEHGKKAVDIVGGIRVFDKPSVTVRS